jgi:hypothetical protein
MVSDRNSDSDSLHRHVLYHVAAIFVVTSHFEAPLLLLHRFPLKCSISIDILISISMVVLFYFAGTDSYLNFFVISLLIALFLFIVPLRLLVSSMMYVRASYILAVVFVSCIVF